MSERLLKGHHGGMTQPEVVARRNELQWQAKAIQKILRNGDSAKDRLLTAVRLDQLAMRYADICLDFPYEAADRLSRALLEVAMTARTQNSAADIRCLAFISEVVKDLIKLDHLEGDKAGYTLNGPQIHWRREEYEGLWTFALQRVVDTIDNDVYQNPEFDVRSGRIPTDEKARRWLGLCTFVTLLAKRKYLFCDRFLHRRLSLLGDQQLIIYISRLPPLPYRDAPLQHARYVVVNLPELALVGCRDELPVFNSCLGSMVEESRFTMAQWDLAKRCVYAFASSPATNPARARCWLAREMGQTLQTMQAVETNVPTLPPYGSTARPVLTSKHGWVWADDGHFPVC